MSHWIRDAICMWGWRWNIFGAGGSPGGSDFLALERTSGDPPVDFLLLESGDFLELE